MISANDPKAICSALNEARSAGTKVVTFDSDTDPDCRDLFINQATRRGHRRHPGRDDRRSHRADGGEIAILSATANATNQNAWIELMKKELAKPEYPKIKLVDTVYGDDDDQKSFAGRPGAAAGAPEPQGHHLADHRRHRGRGPLPVRLRVQGQGRADRARHPEPDARVRQGRHRQVVRAVEPSRSSATSPPTPARRSSPARSPARRATRSRPAPLGEFTVGADGTVLLGDADRLQRREHRPVQLLGTPAPALTSCISAGVRVTNTHNAVVLNESIQLRWEP